MKIAQNGAVSYPIIAGGRVFVTGPGESGDSLYAFAVSDGHPLWGPVPVGTRGATPAYDDGRLYVFNSYGVLQAFDPASGRSLWSTKMPGQDMFEAQPTASGGMVYLFGGDYGADAYGVDGATGVVRWQVPINGAGTAPAVSPKGVFVSVPCQSYDLDPATGATVWHEDGPCAGCCVPTPALYGGLLYSVDKPGGNRLTDAATGRAVGTFQSDVPPAFRGNVGYFITNNVLEARDLGTGAVRFSVPVYSTYPPLVVNDSVFLQGRGGNLVEYDANTGAGLWSDPVVNHGTDTPFPGGPVTMSLGEGDGVLVVPTYGDLVAYG
ncbi:MAG: PQQ-like beta-propeller repeat protein [Acidimicrobiia bacterium]|nr:PQQ-like beta-propeller repeat protein [Acidimicrobiia bacterium]